MDINLRNEINKRRTFAIISHPDAGKTTLTEKLLLYAGLLRTAGMVRGRKNSKHASSDWLQMEQDRGISISASAMQFPYKDYLLNVLDTPGHQDFSEDTYRTLTAADAAVMVIDASKGVEEQTKKLFKVCRMRGIPIITFVNKMDLPAKDLFSLLQEIEEVLGIASVPINWPIGSGRDFCGVIDIETKKCQIFEKTSKLGSKVLDKKEYDFAALDIAPDLRQKAEDELELLEVAGNEYDEERFLAGEVTPVFFGSALSNFGVEYFFDNFVKLAPRPRPVRGSSADEDSSILDPYSEDFVGFVFKLQANMNKKHRDSMAFIRVCSGIFSRDEMVVNHTSGNKVRISRSYSLVASNRDTIDNAYPGDIIGVSNQGFAIGDTVSFKGLDFKVQPMPQFPPEIVCEITLNDVMRLKSFEKGMVQLTSEGTVSLLTPKNNSNARWVSAVGKLQFEVLESRLSDEYNVKVEMRMLPYRFGIYVEGEVAKIQLTTTSALAYDKVGRTVLLYTNAWEEQLLRDRNPDVRFVPFIG